METNSNNQQLIQTQQNLQTSLISRDTLANTNPQQIQIITQSQPQSQNSTRLNSLDFHRGLTIFGMILANSGQQNGPWFMKHAQWDGLTPVDLIFPSFLFIMGMAVPLAVTQKKPVKLRNLLRVLGLFLIGQIICLYKAQFDFSQLRIPGILQRLSLCYGCMILIHWATQYGKIHQRIYGTLAIVCAFFVFISYIISFKNPSPQCEGKSNLSPQCNLTSYIDRKLFTDAHIMAPHDPEGLFSVLPSFFTTYMGYYFCLIMKDNKSDIKKTLKQWFIICFILGLSVYPLTKLMPLNKKMFSASFAVLTACVSGLALIVIILIVDILPKYNEPGKRIVNVCITPFIWMGRNPLFIYVLSEIFSQTLEDYIKINDQSFDQVIEYRLLNSWIGNGAVSAQIKSFIYLLIYLIPTYVLFRKGIFIRL